MDNKWQLSARACCTTLMASVAGGWVALVQSYFMNNKKQDVLTVVNGILGALVGVTGGCAVFNVYSSMVVGAVGSFLANIPPPLLEYWRLLQANCMRPLEFESMTLVLRGKYLIRFQ